MSLRRLLSLLLGVDVDAMNGGHGLGCRCNECRARLLASRGKPFPAGSLGELLRDEVASHRGAELLHALRPGRWRRATHSTRPGLKYEIRENPSGSWDVREIGADEPCTRGVDAAYVRAEFRFETPALLAGRWDDVGGQREAHHEVKLPERERSGNDRHGHGRAPARSLPFPGDQIWIHLISQWVGQGKAR